MTPSAWGFGGNIELPGTNTVAFRDTYGNITSGAYYDLSQGRWEYAANSYAAMYRVGDTGSHQWFTAPSGTAGNAISFTQAMTLDASGNLLVGATTASNYKLHVQGSGNMYAGVEVTGDTNVGIRFKNTGREYGIFTDGSFGASNALRFYDFTAGAERARITSNGNLLVGINSEGGGIGFNARFVGYSATETIEVLKCDTATRPITYYWSTAGSGDNLFITFTTDAGASGRGSITYNRAGGLVAYNTTSDYRAKDILGPVANPGATIDALKVYTGKMKGATQSRPMLVAHEAQEVAPYAVSGTKDEMNADGSPKFQQMDHASMVPLLIAELQSLRARVAQLEKGMK